jgi:hypothetical protein
VIESDTDSRQDLGAGLGFRGWTYVKVAITPNIDDPATSTDICADTGCSITLANRAWVKQFYPEVDFRKRATQVLVRGLGKGRHRTSDYVTLPFYLGGGQTRFSRGVETTAIGQRGRWHGSFGGG